MMYVARCKKGLVVAGSIADTPLQQADSASDVKKWIKKGYNVTLEEPKNPLEWCYVDHNCKLCIREDI